MMTAPSQSLAELETRHATLKHRLTELVDSDKDPDEVVRLLREKNVLSRRIEAATTERERAENEQRRREQESARTELPTVRAECLKQRDAFLRHYREACVCLGKYLDLKWRASELTGKGASAAFGPLPEDRNALRALEFSAPPADVVRVGLKPKIDADWKLSFPITPMDEQIKTR